MDVAEATNVGLQDGNPKDLLDLVELICALSHITLRLEWVNNTQNLGLISSITHRWNVRIIDLLGLYHELLDLSRLFFRL